MDRITKLYLRNVRAFESLELELGKNATILIGVNGAGKSTILESLEILRRCAEPNFNEMFYTIHRGLPGIMRRGAISMELGVDVSGDDGILMEYRIVLASHGPAAIITSETVKNAKDGFPILSLEGGAVEVWNGNATGKKEFQTLLSPRHGPAISLIEARLADSRIDRVCRVLQSIEIHLPFDVHATWAARTLQRTESMRASATHFPADRLRILGSNLANAWSEIRSRPSADWEHAMSLVKLGLGDDVDSVAISPDHGGGNIYLALRMKNLPEPIYASELSDGQLSWLAFVAMTRLNQSRSLLAVDEPELHLHPALLGRVVSMLTHLPGGAPVIISTHSDRVLELLDDPADAVRVCSLNGGRAEVSRVDAEALPRWLEQFGDFGQLRAAGYLPHVLLSAAEDDDANSSSREGSTEEP